jgi:uroporphyrinogen-III decarboxylase
MTVKQRITAAVHMQPVDRIPLEPKLNNSYSKHWGKTVSDWHREFESDRTDGVNAVFKEKRKKTGYEEIISGKEKIITFSTPYGDLRLIDQFDEESQSWHPVKFPISNKADVEKLTFWYEDADVEFDKDACDRAVQRYADIGDSAYVVSSVGISSLQYFVEHLAGIEEGHYLLADYPDTVKELFAAMHRNLLKKVKIQAEHSPADTLLLVENTSTTIVSPSQYESISYPQIREYCDASKAAGKDMMIHMCGHLKLLLPLLSTLSATSFESLTTPTVGDITLHDCRKACPDICLMGGTNAYVWLWPSEKIIEYIEQQLDLLPCHRGIVLSSGGAMPRDCPPETIKAVKQWLNNYPLRC